MDCEEFVELTTAFLDGALPAQDEARFVAHLAECEGCAAYLGQFRRTVDSLGALSVVAERAVPAEALSESARAKLLAAFQDWQQR